MGEHAGHEVQTVTLPLQKQRVLAFLAEHEHPAAMNLIGRAVFAERTFRTNQGAALAVQPVLRRLEQDGLVRKVYTRMMPSGGYVLAD